MEGDIEKLFVTDPEFKIHEQPCPPNSPWLKIWFVVKRILVGLAFVAVCIAIVGAMMWIMDNYRKPVLYALGGIILLYVLYKAGVVIKFLFDI